MTTIEIKVTPKESVDISVGNALQEIEVVNVSKQTIDIIEQDSSQNIEIENTFSQEIDIEQNIKIITVYDDNIPKYEGAYEVTPKLKAQKLPTAFKMMQQDVEIKEIPIIKVSNQGGGNTVIIGG